MLPGGAPYHYKLVKTGYTHSITSFILVGIIKRHHNINAFSPLYKPVAPRECQDLIYRFGVILPASMLMIVNFPIGIGCKKSSSIV